MMHETHRISREPGEAPPSSREALKKREGDPGDRPPGSSLPRSRPSLDPGLEKGWRCGVGGQADAGTALEADREAAREAPEAAARRGDGVRSEERRVGKECRSGWSAHH